MSANLKQHVAALDVYKKHLKNKRSMEMKIKKLEEIVESKQKTIYKLEIDLMRYKNIVDEK